MTERITRKSVTFMRPFSLDGVDGVQPAGTYTIETVEEPLGNLSLIARRRVELLRSSPLRRSLED
jgi:hypothetical protein